MIFRYGPAE